MIPIIIGQHTDGRDDFCVECGYPFDPGDAAYKCDAAGEPIVCSHMCGTRQESRRLADQDKHDAA